MMSVVVVHHEAKKTTPGFYLHLNENEILMDL